MESELEKFRRRKQQEEKKAEIKAKFKATTDSWARYIYEALLPNWNEQEEDEDCDDKDNNHGHVGGGEKKIPGTSLSHNLGSGSSKNKTNKWITYAVIMLRFLAWLFVYIAFLKIGFGAVFFTISSLVFIYWNTKSRRRKKKSISAYSVFNKDCQSIDGTLKAEHLEKQLLYRS